MTTPEPEKTSGWAAQKDAVSGIAGFPDLGKEGIPTTEQAKEEDNILFQRVRAAGEKLKDLELGTLVRDNQEIAPPEKE